MRPTHYKPLRALIWRSRFTGATVALTAAVLAPLATGTSTAAANPVRIFAQDTNVLIGDTAYITGTIGANRAGEQVALQARQQHHWHTIASAISGRQGHFRVHYTPHDLATVAIRLRVHPIGEVVGPLNTTAGTCPWTVCPAQLAGPAPLRAVTRHLGYMDVYREVLASWYGGGGTMACGGYLTSSTLGVANKTLPCGTMVTLRYGSRSLRVPVVDRGPYVEGREYDLTEATRRALGFPGLGELWSSR